jgi:tetratricopeptide (TPR) repeat protein
MSKKRRSPAAPAPAASTPFTFPAWTLWAAIFALALLAYWPALNGGFIWDDAQHVTRPDLRSTDGLARIWTDLSATQQYYPLLHSFFWFEHQLWGDNVLGYHLLNVLLHALAACLVVLVARRLEIPGAWLAGLLFALHPVAVEAVAWISEQKSTFSTVFYLSALLAYLSFDRTRRRSRYFLALGFFLLALMSKTVTATLPAALLVIFWWKRGRLNGKRDVLPLLPWFAIGISAGLFTAWVERTYIGAAGEDFTLNFLERSLLAGRVAWFYFSKLVLPLGLVFHYPRWTIDASVWWQYIFPVALLALAATLVWIARRNRAPLTALLLFGGTLFPALGFFNVYPFLYSYVADHFQYLASIAILVALAAALSRLPARARPWTAAALLTCYAVLSWSQCQMYQDADTLYRETIRRNPTCWLAHNNLGANILEIRNQPAEALPYFETALRLNPRCAMAFNNLGNALSKLNRLTEATVAYQSALRLKPEASGTHTNLGNLYTRQGRTADALAEHLQAVRLDPRSPQIHNNLGTTYAQLDRFPEAAAEFESALGIDPNYLQARRNLGFAHLKMGQFARAAESLRIVVQSDPASPEAHFTLGFVLGQIPGRLHEAIAEYQYALRLNPDFAPARQNLANAEARLKAEQP